MRLWQNRSTLPVGLCSTDINRFWNFFSINQVLEIVPFLAETVEEALARLDQPLVVLSDSCIEAVTKLLLPAAPSGSDGHVFVDAKCHISRLIAKHKATAQEGEKYTVDDFRNDCILQIFGRHPVRGKVPLTTGEIKELWPKVKCLLIPICTHYHWVWTLDLSSNIYD